MNPLLEVRDLSRSFEGLIAVDRLNLTVREGEIRCIIGPNGAGKSTVFNLITGRLRPTSGEVRFCGRPITGLPPHLVTRLGIGRKFQIPNIYQKLTVQENVLIPLLRQELGTATPLRALLRTRIAPAVFEWVEQVLRDVTLLEKRHHQAASLSHGEKQRLEIGAVVAGRPKLLLLDEPTAGMSVEETSAIAQLVRQVAQMATVVVIEHDMAFVRELASRISVLARGTLLTEGTLAEVEADQRVRDIYLGRQWGAAD